MPRNLSFEQVTGKQVQSLLIGLVDEMVKKESHLLAKIKSTHPSFLPSASNLVHYLVLRSTEIRKAQEFLHHKGLSSLTNCESHTLSQVQNVLRWLSENGKTGDIKPPCDFATAKELKDLHNEQLLGIPSVPERPHIMVTFSPEMALDKVKIEKMLMAGMSVARINCAHDDPETWERMISLLKKAITKTGKSCKIYMDLSGPRIRIRSIKGDTSHKELPVKENNELILTDRPKATKKMRKKPVVLVDPEGVLSFVKRGERVFFDDGKFEAKVKRTSENELTVRITRISTKKPFLRPQKGINLPDSELKIHPLTNEDKAHIPFICQHADLVGYSFVSTAADVELLREELAKYSTQKKPAIILKMERLAAIENLPELLVNGMKDEAFGVMIARGDLAVEIGFERLSEIQEEILWICEAAHVPVIWATQVLEKMNKTGFATRSEITDAAMGVMAECVMLNKGKHIVKTIRMLEDILIRHLGHVDKKRYIMRPLGIAKNFVMTIE